VNGDFTFIGLIDEQSNAVFVGREMDLGPLVTVTEMGFFPIPFDLPTCLRFFTIFPRLLFVYQIHFLFIVNVSVTFNGSRPSHLASDSSSLIDLSNLRRLSVSTLALPRPSPKM
jgi:hypothetical protein